MADAEAEYEFEKQVVQQELTRREQQKKAEILRRMEQERLALEAIQKENASVKTNSNAGTPENAEAVDLEAPETISNKSTDRPQTGGSRASSRPGSQVKRGRKQSAKPRQRISISLIEEKPHSALICRENDMIITQKTMEVPLSPFMKDQIDDLRVGQSRVASKMYERQQLIECRFKIVDDPDVNLPEVYSSKSRLAKRVKRHFNLYNQSEIIYLDEDSVKFDVPVNTTIYRNIVRIMYEKKYLLTTYCPTGVDTRQMPIIDLEALQEIEEMERRIARELAEKLARQQELAEEGEQGEEEQEEGEEAEERDEREVLHKRKAKQTSGEEEEELSEKEILK